MPTIRRRPPRPSAASRRTLDQVLGRQQRRQATAPCSMAKRASPVSSTSGSTGSPAVQRHLRRDLLADQADHRPPRAMAGPRARRAQPRAVQQPSAPAWRSVTCPARSGRISCARAVSGPFSPVRWGRRTAAAAVAFSDAPSSKSIPQGARRLGRMRSMAQGARRFQPARAPRATPPGAERDRVVRAQLGRPTASRSSPSAFRPRTAGERIAAPGRARARPRYAAARRPLPGGRARSAAASSERSGSRAAVVEHADPIEPVARRQHHGIDKIHPHRQHGRRPPAPGRRRGRAPASRGGARRAGSGGRAEPDQSDTTKPSKPHSPRRMPASSASSSVQ